MEQRIVFGVMSATQSPAIVDQLAGLLHPHTVVVHHDCRKRADYRPTAPNVELVPDPRDTGWGTWGFSDAIFHTLRHALDRHDFDYFQLLSPTCLPLRPLEEFEAFVASDSADVHADQMAVDRDDDTLMHFGYRTFAQFPSLKFRLLRRTRGWYFDEGADFIQTQSLAMFRRRGADTGRPPTLAARSALWLARQAARGRMGAHPFDERLRPMIGGTFFGARRAVCEYLVGMSGRDAFPDYLRHLQIVDETLFATLIGNSRFRVGRANHAINDFTEEGNPRWVEPADLERLTATGRFFGRKFPDDPDAPIRQTLLERLRDAQAVT
jgi:hypothetical protein